MHNAADMSDDVSSNRSHGRNGRERDMRDEERSERERKSSSEMYSRINNPEKYNTNDNVIRVRKESVDLKLVDFYENKMQGSMAGKKGLQNIGNTC